MMKKITDDYEVKNDDDATKLFIEAIKFRDDQKNMSADIARYVFAQTQPAKIGFELRKDLSDLRYEFTALEAPGWPPGWPNMNEMSPEKYDDFLWDRLLNLVVQAKERGQFGDVSRS